MFFVFLYTIENTKDAKNAKITWIIPEYKCANANKNATTKIDNNSTEFLLKNLFSLKNLSDIMVKTWFNEKNKYIRYKTSS